jgi:hypothetical protein
MALLKWLALMPAAAMVAQAAFTPEYVPSNLHYSFLWTVQPDC